MGNFFKGLGLVILGLAIGSAGYILLAPTYSQRGQVAYNQYSEEDLDQVKDLEDGLVNGQLPVYGAPTLLETIASSFPFNRIDVFQSYAEEKKSKEKITPPSVGTPIVTISKGGQKLSGVVALVNGDTLAVSVVFPIKNPIPAGTVKKYYVSPVGFNKEGPPFLKINGSILANGKKRTSARVYLTPGVSKLTFTYSMVADTSMVLAGEKFTFIPGFFKNAGVTITMGDSTTAHPEFFSNYCDDFAKSFLGGGAAPNDEDSFFFGHPAFAQTVTSSAIDCPSANADWRTPRGKFSIVGSTLQVQAPPHTGVNRTAVGLAPVHVADGTISSIIKTSKTIGFPYKNGCIMTSFGGYAQWREVCLLAHSGIMTIEQRTLGSNKTLTKMTVPAVIGTAYPMKVVVKPQGAGETVTGTLTIAGKDYTLSYSFPDRIAGPVGVSDSFAQTNFDDFHVCQGAGPCTFTGVSGTPTPSATTTGITVITSLTPTSGPVGTMITINGTGFSATGNRINIKQNSSGFAGVIPAVSSSDGGKIITFAMPGGLDVACHFATPACEVATKQVDLGSYGISVTTASGENSNVLNFTVTDQVASCTPSDFGLHEGDLIGAVNFGDPDIYIINEFCYKRIFLNPIIFNFYSHLGGYDRVKKVTAEVRDAFQTSMLYRNAEGTDQKVYALQTTGEDSGILHWINISASQALVQDPKFSQKIFNINNNEFNWLTSNGTSFGVPYTSLNQVPVYHR